MKYTVEKLINEIDITEIVKNFMLEGHKNGVDTKGMDLIILVYDKGYKLKNEELIEECFLFHGPKMKGTNLPSKYTVAISSPIVMSAAGVDLGTFNGDISNIDILFIEQKVDPITKNTTVICTAAA